MKSRWIRTVVLVLVLCGASFAAAQSPQKPGEVRRDLLVSTAWLAEHLRDPHLVLVHVGGSVGDYQVAHIPGARYLAAEKFIDTHAKTPAELLPVEQIKANLEEIGVGDDSRIIFYAPDWDPIATRLFFTLDYIGHGDQSALLDGGMDQWLHEKRATPAETPKFERGSLTLHLHPEVLVKLDAMKQMTAGTDGNVAIVDSRPFKRYRSGHLAGAAPLFWELGLVSAETPVLKSPDELRKLLAERGVTAGKKVVSYCEVGYQASHTYFLARYLGMPAAMYDGSYNEWTAEKQPVVRGEAPR